MTKKKNIQVCYNPAMPHFLLHKQGFFKHILQENDTLDIFEELAQYKSILTNDNKIKTLVISQNKVSCKFLEEQYKKQSFYEHFDFVFKHKTQITGQNKQNNFIENEEYDLVFVYEGNTIKWLFKNKIKLNSNFYIYFHVEQMPSKIYQKLSQKASPNAGGDEWLCPLFLRIHFFMLTFKEYYL